MMTWLKTDETTMTRSWNLTTAADRYGVPPLPTPPPPPSARLVRPRDDRVVAGVASGLARYVGVDPALVRIVFVLLTVFGGSGLLAYLIAWLVIPDEPVGHGPPATAAQDPAALRLIAGVVLVLLGASWLLGQLVPHVSRIAWPVALIVLGIVIVTAGVRR